MDGKDHEDAIPGSQLTHARVHLTSVAVDTTCWVRPQGNGERIEPFRPPFARATGSATQPPDTPGSLMQRTKSMRDFRDAKAMAQTLRESLTTKAINISHSESLELSPGAGTPARRDPPLRWGDRRVPGRGR